MLSPELKLQDDFPPAEYEKWRELVEADLKGAPFEKRLVTHSYEGIDIQPVYSRHDFPTSGDPAGFPGFPPFVRGASPLGISQTGWVLQQEHAHPDLQVSNEHIRADLEGGVQSLLLRLDSAARQGYDPDAQPAAELAGRDGLMAYHVDDLDALLADVDLSETSIALDAGAAFLPAAATLVGLWQRRGIALAEAKGAFHADPLAVWASTGQLPMPPAKALSQLADLAKWTAENCPGVTSVRVGTAAYHHAGANATQDLAFSMATGVSYLRAMQTAGMSIDDAARQIVFTDGVGTHHFLSIAKLRAARKLWARVVEVCGGSPAAGAMRLHARMSKRVMTRRDPYVNLLRNTVAVFAAGIGGAETITSVPFDAACGLPSDFSRRIARNTVLVLQEEANLHRSIDPAGGSWYLDSLTEQVADEAWKIFQEIEQRGGMLEVIRTDWITEQIAAAYAPREKDLATRKEGLTGVSEFPNIHEEPVRPEVPNYEKLRETASARIAKQRCDEGNVPEFAEEKSPMAIAVEAVGGGASIGQMASGQGFHNEPANMTPMPLHTFAQSYEQLRDACDQWLLENKHRPFVFLANMGPVAHHTARATFSKNFFEAGGFEAISNDGFADAETAVAAFRDSDANIAVVCSSDKLYPEFVPEVAQKLKAGGARTVILAGYPGENEAAWREAGVDQFIYMKCDVLGTLQQLLAEEGVLPS